MAETIRPTKSSNLELDEQVYSILSGRQKRIFALFILVCSVWSTLSASIYFPALPIISNKFLVSSSITNLSVVAFLVFQGIGPTVVAPFADLFGRRPLLLTSLISYVAVNVAISQTNVFWLLVVLRSLQSFTIAPLIAISAGTVGDICPPSERGGYVSLITGVQLVGQAFGALVGAGLVARWGWRGPFVFLAIGAGSVFIVAIFTYPETHRLYVGNMSVRAKNLVHRAPLLELPAFKKHLNEDRSTLENKRVRLGQFAAPFKIFLDSTVFFNLLAPSLQYAAMVMAMTTLSTTLEKRYNYSIVHIGLCYLAPGFGTLIGSIFAGRILNWVYKRSKDNYDRRYQTVPENDRPPFNIVKARLNFTLFPAIFGTCFYLMFGWCLEYKVNLAPILIACFIICFCGVMMISSSTTLLVDLYPEERSSATSCLNLMRCLLAAAGVGSLQSMVNALGEGGAYSIMFGLCLLGLVLLFWQVRLKSTIREKGKEENEKETQDLLNKITSGELEGV